MKKITFLFLLSSCLSFGQVKLWNNKLEKIKTKGTYLIIEKEQKTPKNNTKIFGIIPTTTIAGTILPFAFNYGNTILKNITSKNETDYNSENISINNLTINFKEIENNSLVFNTNLNYYPKGESVNLVASKYSFSIKKEENSLLISLISTDGENYVPIKSKKKYDFILETFDFKIQAEISTKINDTLRKSELLNLGSTKITRTIASFTNNVHQTLNNGIVFFPKYTSSGKEITVKNLILTCTVTYLNPYGLTQSSLNKFLENNSDTNESLFNTIFIK